jgi:hypothetical protein
MEMYFFGYYWECQELQNCREKFYLFSLVRLMPEYEKPGFHK